jgi:uncharacterized membrane protein
MDFHEFFQIYFVEPLGKYYTVPNTIVYGVIFILAVYFVYRLLERLQIKVDKKFAFALLPFILYGGTTRALRDANVYQGILFVSPFLYLFVFSLAFLSLVISLWVERRFEVPYYRIMFIFGMIMLTFNLTFIRIENPQGLFSILILFSLSSSFLFALHKIFPQKLSLVNFAVVSSHLLDACSAFVATEFFGYFEQHVLTGFLMSVFGNWVIIPAKIFVVWLVLWLIDTYSKDSNFNNWLKLVIFILGLALGTRNTLRLTMGV